MMDKEHIRLCKSSYNVDGKYWYHPEIKRKNNSWLFGDSYQWEQVYAVNYKTFSTSYKLTSISPHNEYELQRFLKECLDWVNYYEEQEDWKLVNYDEYKRVLNLKQEQKCNKNKYVYL